MASYKLTVPAPVITERDFWKPLMCGPGPSDVSSEVTAALTSPVISPICPEYHLVMDDIRAGIQYLFQTRSKLVLALSGSGHAGMETVISNLLGPGELLLVASRGIWDERACDMAKRYGIKVEAFHTAPFTTFSLEEIEAALEQHRPAGLFITHGDSSTGTLQVVNGLGDLCHKYGTLLLVDVVASVGAEPFLMDEWDIDAAYAVCQKVLSGPAGIAPVAFSARAEAKINSRTHDPPFYFDMKLLARQWNCYDNTFFYHHTLSHPLLWALRRCLKQVARESLPRAWARHAAAAARLHARLQHHGFCFLVREPEDRMAAVTTVLLPKGIDCYKFVTQMRDKYGTLLLVDVVASVGAEPFLMDEWDIDAAYAVCQKVLSGPAGIAPVAFSARADAKINSRTHDTPFYFDMKLLARQWNCYDNTFFYHHTLSYPLLWALRRCLKQVARESLPRAWARHAAATARLHARLQHHGFCFLVREPEDRMAAVTTVLLPQRIDCYKFVDQMRDKHNIYILPGLGPTTSKAVRVGIMGVNATTDVAERVADAMADIAGLTLSTII